MTKHKKKTQKYEWKSELIAIDLLAVFILDRNKYMIIENMNGYTFAI